MNTNLVKYKADIYVPDTENQGNYEIKGTVEVTYKDDQELQDKVEAYIKEHEIDDDEEILELIIKVIDKI